MMLMVKIEKRLEKNPVDGESKIFMFIGGVGCHGEPVVFTQDFLTFKPGEVAGPQKNGDSDVVRNHWSLIAPLV